MIERQIVVYRSAQRDEKHELRTSRSERAGAAKPTLLLFRTLATISITQIQLSRVVFTRVLAIVIMSVRPSVLVSRPTIEPSPGQIKTPGFHQMIAYSL